MVKRIVSGDGEYTPPPTVSPPPGETTTQRVITITELYTIDDTRVPDHTILQLIKELGDKGMRVLAKLKAINADQVR